MVPSCTIPSTVLTDCCGCIIVLCVYRDIGQQCCYDAKGWYTTNNPSAGSADYRYPYDHYLLHQSSDYFPYKACCIDSNDAAFCNLYYELRPKGNGTCHTNKPKIGKLCTYLQCYKYLMIIITSTTPYSVYTCLKN